MVSVVSTERTFAPAVRVRLWASPNSKPTPACGKAATRRLIRPIEESPVWRWMQKSMMLRSQTAMMTQERCGWCRRLFSTKWTRTSSS